MIFCLKQQIIVTNKKQFIAKKQPFIQLLMMAD